MLVHTHRSRPLFVIYHAFLLCLVASILPRGTRHHQVDGQAVGGRPPTGRDNRLFLRDLISYVPISPLQVPVGYPQKLIAVVEELDEENGDLVRTHLCYMAFNGPEDLSNQMVRFISRLTIILSCIGLSSILPNVFFFYIYTSFTPVNTVQLTLSLELIFA